MCKECISHKENKNNLESYFREILPDYDEDRVYISDIKKVFQWYNALFSGLVELSKKKKSTKPKNKRKMNNIIKVPKRPKRKFVSEDLVIDSWKKFNLYLKIYSKEK